MFCTSIFALSGLIFFVISIPMFREARKITNKPIPIWILDAPISGFKYDYIEEHDMPLIGCLGTVIAGLACIFLTIALLRILTLG